MRTLLTGGLLALALSTPGAHGQPTPAPKASAVDPAAVQALKDMGAHLQTLKRFRVSSDFTGERVLKSGEKLQHSAAADLEVVRPSKLRIRMWSARNERLLNYDGETVTVYSPAQKYYSTVEFSDSIVALIDRLEQRFGMQLPLTDLFRWGTPEASIDKIESAMNAGQDFVDDDLCDHYAFRQGKIDWQIWIAAGAKPLPRKVVITSRSDEARPQSVSVITWDLKTAVNDSAFKFTPPKDAKKIDMAERKASAAPKVK